MQRPPDVDGKRLAALVRRAFGDADVSLERTPEGVSAQVYRVTKASQIFYLRVAEDAAQDLRVDAEVHHELFRRGVRVPEVTCADAEWLVMTEVPGAPVTADEPEVARAAGRDLARLNQVPAPGFGWIREPLPSYADFVVSYLPAHLPPLWSAATRAAIEAEVAAERRVLRPRACLAHGDFDATQIFAHGGRYTGVIDLGELRGTEPTFDLGHFYLQHGGDSPLWAPLVQATPRSLAPPPCRSRRSVAPHSFSACASCAAGSTARAACHSITPPWWRARAAWKNCCRLADRRIGRQLDAHDRGQRRRVRIQHDDGDRTRQPGPDRSRQLGARNMRRAGRKSATECQLRRCGVSKETLS